MAYRCKTGLVTLPTRSPARAAPLRALNVTETRQMMNAVATGNFPGFTLYKGVTYLPGQPMVVDPFDVPTLGSKIQILEELPTPDWWTSAGRVLQCEPGLGTVFTDHALAGSLKIVQGTGYDPGNAAYRFHSAMNEHTKHASAFVRYLTRNNNPFNCPTQVNATTDPKMVRALLLEADVVHCHVDWILTANVGFSPRPKAGQLVIRHYHGTQFTIDGKREPDARQVVRLNATADDVSADVLVGARLTLCALRPSRVHWLPITVPVARYAAMGAATVQKPWPRRPFRVAHSPTKSILKGTREFLQICKRLNARGVPIQPVMIERKHHSAALALKATADACFDAFELGIQGSGLEAAAMGQPVLAGDPHVADLYRQEFGEVPWTFTPTWQRLEQELERLAMDQAYYEAERARVGAYVTAVHDYPAVAKRYEGILASALGREDVLTQPKRKRRSA